MKIDLSKLQYVFRKKPVLVGGKAMEYYGLRKSGEDTDFIADKNDVIELIKLFPNKVKDLRGDLGVCPYEFEIWRTICYFDYEYYREKAVEDNDYYIVSLEKLLFMKSLAINKKKNVVDLRLIIKKTLSIQTEEYKKQERINNNLLRNIENIVYIEKIGLKE